MPARTDKSPTARKRGTSLGRIAAAGLMAAGLTVAPAIPAGAVTEVAAPGWGACADLQQPAQGLECAKLDVPLNYADPRGQKIRIGISRLASTNPAKKRGVLVLEPGGQSGSELALPLRLVSQGIPASVRESYDLIAFDPRGIGASTQVTCDLRPDQDLNIPPSRYAKTAAEVSRRAAELREIAGQCATSASAGLAPHMSVANVARDLDRIRESLHQKQISYLGYSFGTYVGAVYATLFPQRTDRFVLDSVVGPGGMDHTWSRRLGQGVEQRFPDFANWLAAHQGGYGLGGRAEEVRAKFDALAGQLDRTPVNGMDGAGFRYLNFAYLFSDSTFPTLAETWKAADLALKGEGPASDVVPPWRADFSGLDHLACNSSTWSKDVGAYQQAVRQDRARYPIFGGAGANLWPCAFWSIKPAEPPVRISDHGPSNILLLSNLRDPGTPVAGAVEMRLALGQRARLVAVDHGGHLVYLNDGNTCADDLTTTFLVTGKRPQTDRFCGATGKQTESLELQGLR
jgi:pimeloyl-ACP methyl ester carboxylesterase